MRPEVTEQLLKSGHAFSFFSTSSSLVRELKVACERRKKAHDQTWDLPLAFFLYQRDNKHPHEAEA